MRENKMKKIRIAAAGDNCMDVYDKENKALIEFITSYGDGYDALLLQMLINDFSHYKGKK